MIEGPDPTVGPRLRRLRREGEALGAMLRKHCRFTHTESGAHFKQRRIGDHSAIATFTVIRTDGIERTFHHGIAYYELAYEFAVAEQIEQPLKGKDHPLMQAAEAEPS